MDTPALLRSLLRASAWRIARQRGHAPAGPWTALRKLFVQERRAWGTPGAPRVGWKRGELIEVATALFGRGDLSEEWGDVGYYVAQTWDWVWGLYAAVTPECIITGAVKKFASRASESAPWRALFVPVVYVGGRREVLDDVE